MTSILIFILISATLKDVKILGDTIPKIRILTDAIKYKDFELFNPTRLVIDLYDCVCKEAREIDTKINKIKKVRMAQFMLEPTVARVVIEMDTIVPYKVKKISNGFDVEFEAKPETVKVTEIKKLPVPEPFFYSSRGKRDPFKPWLGVPSSSDTLLDVGSAVILGIMWSPKERYAIIQDASNRTFILREGDKVSGGKVSKIEKEKVIFAMQAFGGIKKVEVKIKKGEK